METSTPEYECRLMPESRGFFYNIALACWDNVLGPRTLCVWSTSEAGNASIPASPQPNSRPVASAATAALRYLPQLMLGSEACYDSRRNLVDSRLFRIDEGDLVAFGLVFSALSPLRRDIASHCFVAVVPGAELPRLVAWRPAVEQLMRRAVQQIQVLLHKGPTAPSSAEDFSLMHPAVAALCDVVVYLRRCGLSSSPKIQETLLGNNTELLSKVAELLCHRGSQADSIGGSSGSTLSTGSPAAVSRHAATPGADLLQLAVYAHLLSFSRSVVLGHCAASVDTMVKTLSLFCAGADEKQRCCIINVPMESDSLTSSTSTEAQLWRFVPELCVQGLLLPTDLADKEAALELLASEILQARLPYAIVRLDCGGSVYLSSTYDVHVLRGRQAERQALHTALTGGPSVEATPDSESCEFRLRMFPVHVKDSSRFASFFKELRLLPTVSQGTVHESFILQYIHYLQRQASVLIHALKTQVLGGASRNAADIKRALFPLEHVDDVRLILAAAERLQPGCCDMLWSDAGLPHAEPVTGKATTVYTSL